MAQKIETLPFNELKEIAKHYRKSLTGDNCKEKDLILFFAHNGIGKTRLSMEFKELGKAYNEEGEVTARDTLYFNAFTEDLFHWDNDLETNINRTLKLNSDSSFFEGLHELELDLKIASFLHNYVDFNFDIDYDNYTVTFSRSIIVNGVDQTIENIKISRGEETLFIWCFFLAICQLVIDKDPAYDWVKYIYIDDPISSLDENNAITVGCDLVNLLCSDEAKDANIKIVISTHHSLFFNVIYNNFGRKLKNKIYFLHSKGANGYVLQTTADTPFFHHIAVISELKRIAETDQIYTFHFNALRSVIEKTASFFGYDKIDDCLEDLKEEEEGVYFERALQIFSHGKYSLFDPTPMVGDNKDLFKRILKAFLEKYEFNFPQIFAEENQEEITE